MADEMSEVKQSKYEYMLYYDLKNLMAIVGTIKFFEKNTRIALQTDPAYSTKKDNIDTFYNYRDRVLTSHLENPRQNNHIVPQNVLDLVNNIISTSIKKNKYLNADTTIDKIYKVTIDLLFDLIANYQKFPNLVKEFRRVNKNNLSEEDTAKYISNAIEMTIDIFDKEPFHLIRSIERNYSQQYRNNIRYNFYNAMILYLSEYKHRFSPEYYFKNIKLINFICKSFSRNRIKGIDIDTYNNFANVIKFFLNNQLTDERSTIMINEKDMFINSTLLTPLGKPHISKNFLDCAIRISEYDDTNLYKLQKQSKPLPKPLNLSTLNLSTSNPSVQPSSQPTAQPTGRPSKTIKLKITDYTNSRNTLVKVYSEMEVSLNDTIEKVKEDYKKLANINDSIIRYDLKYIKFSTDMGYELESGKKVRDYKELLERNNNIYIPRNGLIS